jgi:RNase P subunit RPR2
MCHGHDHSDTPIKVDFYVNYCDGCYTNRRQDCDAAVNEHVETLLESARRHLEKVLASDEYDTDDLRNRTIRHLFFDYFQSIEDYETKMKIRIPESFKSKIADLCCSECDNPIKPKEIRWAHPPINYWPEKLPDGGKEYRETSSRWTKEHLALYWGYVDRTPKPEFPEKHLQTPFDEYKNHEDLKEYYTSIRAWYLAREHYKLCSEECMDKLKGREPGFVRVRW